MRLGTRARCRIRSPRSPKLSVVIRLKLLAPSGVVTHSAELAWAIVPDVAATAQSAVHQILTGLAITAVLGAVVAISLLLVPAQESQADLAGVECESDVIEVCDAVAFVEVTRGRAFKTFPTITFLEPSEFATRLQALWEDDDDYDAESNIDIEAWQVLGLIEADIAVEDLVTNSAAAVLGIYLSLEEGLWVRAGEMTLLARSVLVHELTHAHDDQWFDLESLDHAMVTSDSVSAISAAVEGNAMRVEEMWRAGLSRPDRDEVVAQEFDSVSPEELAELDAYPEVLLTVQAWPYSEGLDFVQWLAEEGGEDAVDELFRHPPLTTEQVFHPDAWSTRERAKDLSPPDISHEAKGNGVLGELVLSLLLGRDAAEGWGGDAFVLYELQGQRCIAVALVADSALDLQEMALAAQRWVQESELADATSQHEAERVTLAGCLEVDL